MADSAAIWKRHVIYRLSHMPARCDEVVQGNVRALEGVTSVAVAPSHDASTHLAFSTRSANALVAAVAAKQCLHKAVDEHNAQGGWQGNVRLVDESAVRKVA